MGLQRGWGEVTEDSSCSVLRFPVESSFGAHGDSPTVATAHTWVSDILRSHTDPPDGPGDG